MNGIIRRALFISLAAFFFTSSAANISFANQLIAAPDDLSAAPLNLPELSGEIYSLDAQKGRVVVVNFWATWCLPCIAELPSLVRLKSRFEPKELDVLAVHIGSKSTAIQKFLKYHNITGLTFLVDAEKQTAATWHVKGLPTTYIINTSGNIHFAAQGEIDWDAPKVIEKIGALIK